MKTTTFYLARNKDGKWKMFMRKPFCDLRSGKWHTGYPDEGVNYPHFNQLPRYKGRWDKSLHNQLEDFKWVKEKEWDVVKGV